MYTTNILFDMESHDTADVWSLRQDCIHTYWEDHIWTLKRFGQCVVQFTNMQVSHEVPCPHFSEGRQVSTFHCWLAWRPTFQDFLMMKVVAFPFSVPLIISDFEAAIGSVVWSKICPTVFCWFFYLVWLQVPCTLECRLNNVCILNGCF